jgi:hypothetical protein
MLIAQQIMKRSDQVNSVGYIREYEHRLLHVVRQICQSLGRSVMFIRMSAVIGFGKGASRGAPAPNLAPK